MGWSTAPKRGPSSEEQCSARQGICFLRAPGGGIATITGAFMAGTLSRSRWLWGADEEQVCSCHHFLKLELTFEARQSDRAQTGRVGNTGLFDFSFYTHRSCPLGLRQQKSTAKWPPQMRRILTTRISRKSVHEWLRYLWGNLRYHVQIPGQAWGRLRQHPGCWRCPSNRQIKARKTSCEDCQRLYSQRLRDQSRRDHRPLEWANG